MNSVDFNEIEDLYQKLKKQAEAAGYHLNPDVEFTKELLKGILIKEKRYEYWACPCRLASGDKKQDLDIICPCDYRDADLNEYGACYCALYVSKDVIDSKIDLRQVPERRPVEKKKEKTKKKSIKKGEM